MKYFYDTEFHDDGNTIDLISIGIIAEDGREYYAVNSEAHWDRINAHPWLPKNVVSQLPTFTSPAWKRKRQIAADVEQFLLHDSAGARHNPELWAWFAAYDHVVLSQLFGRMLDLPEGMPMYSHDLRSLIDWVGVASLPAQKAGLHDALEDARHLKSNFEYVMQRGIFRQRI